MHQPWRLLGFSELGVYRYHFKNENDDISTVELHSWQYLHSCTVVYSCITQKLAAGKQNTPPHHTYTHISHTHNIKKTENVKFSLKNEISTNKPSILLQWFLR